MSDVEYNENAADLSEAEKIASQTSAK